MYKVRSEPLVKPQAPLVSENPLDTVQGPGVAALSVLQPSSHYLQQLFSILSYSNLENDKEILCINFHWRYFIENLVELFFGKYKVFFFFIVADLIWIRGQGGEQLGYSSECEIHVRRDGAVNWL